MPRFEPASPAQEGMWFLHQLAPASPFYNVPMSVAFDTGWDVNRVRAAVRELVDRHEALRVSYALDETGVPVQVVADRLDIDVPHTRAARPDEIEAVAQAIFEAPFDLERGPLLRAHAVTTGRGSGLLLLTLHHSVCDHWSLSLLGQELRTLVRGRSLPPAGQYSQFARWQQASLRDGELAEQLAYWRQRLAGAPPVIDLPLDRPRSASTSFHGATQHARLGPRLSRAVEALARAQGATVFMTLMAAFDLLLHRSARQSDIVVGTWIAGRNRTEHERTVGAFANTLLVRTDLGGNPTFTALLEQVRERVLEALAHQDVRIETLVKELAPARTAAHMPLCQVVYTHQNLPQDTLAARRGGRRRSAPGVARNSTKYDLVLFSHGEGSAEGVELRLEYASDLFDDATARRLLAAFERILEQVVRDPSLRIGDIELMAPAERRRILVDWNATEASFPKRATLESLFREQARRAPQAEAVRHRGRSVSAADLDAAADRVAAALRGLRVGAGDVVGVCGPRSPELVAGMLGAMRAGAAYLPLDPAYPPDRLALMLEDSRARVTLTFGDPPLEGATARVPLEGCLDGGAIDTVEPEGRAELAYVIYTSGSTGRPKGVMGRHRSTVNRLAWQWRALPYGPGEVCVQKTAISFVDSVAEVFGPLLRGVPLVIVDDTDARDPFRLLDELAAHAVTRIVVVPSLLRSLLDVAPDLGSRLPSLTTWVTSGEALSGELAARLAEAHPRARLVNLYGSSEVAADATWHEVVDARPGEPVPIGRPIANTAVYILDRYLRPVPVGTTGEIWVAGEGLATGYIHRPDLTAERFVELHLEGRRVRAYRTGDLGRLRPDGAILYMGRADHQLKIRGVRVEPGEVEAVLRTARGVRGALVIGQGTPEDRRLVAYLEANGRRSAVDAARAAVERELPPHMRPAVYVPLRSFPLTPNGKVNRLALPPPPEHDARAAAEYEGPRNEREAGIAQIFASVLGVAEVGVHDDFFALGGHSLTATQVIARLRAAFASEVPLAALFEAPTVAGLAERLEAAGTLPAAAPLERDPRPRAPLSFGQRRLWFLDQLQPGSRAYHIAQTFRFRMPLEPSLVEQALNLIVARHESLRTTFASEEGEPYQVISPAVQIRLRAAHLRDLPPAERAAEAQRIARDNFILPFDLARGPLLRAALVTEAEDSHVLFICVHHAVSDGWSMEVLDAELRTVIDTLAAGHTAALPALPIQYADFARWQRELLRGEALERELGHWRSRLAGAPALLNLPTDHPRAAIHGEEGDRIVRVLPRSVRRAVDEFARAHEATTFMTLLAVFKALLARWSGQDDVVVGSPVAGRTRVEVEPLIGFFVNTVALRTDLSGDPSFLELVERVRATALEAYDHQDLPFERLVEEIAPERDLSRSPLFQVMFVFQNAGGAAAHGKGVPRGPRRGDLRRVHWDFGAYASKFDLTLTAAEQPRALRLQVEYARDLFEAATIGRFLDQLEVLLEAALAAPATPVSRLPLLKPAELALLDAFADPAPAPANPGSLTALFAARVAAHRSEVAVVDGEERITYGELDARSNRLANHLACQGVRAGDRVGIRLGRTAAMVEAVLAAVKLGAAYVPLDPTAPAARGRFILEDAGARVVVGELEDSPCPVVDPRSAAVAAAPRRRPRARVRPEDVAYILYTSGSTGRPKGVLVEHRNVAGYCAAVAEATGATGPGIRYAMLQPLHVDSSVTALWGSLLGGGQLHLVSPETAADARRLATLLRRERIDHLKIAPSHLRALHAAGDPRRLMPRRWLVIGGEGSPWEWVRTLPGLRRGCRVFNHYGPTETTVGVTVYPVNPNLARRHDITPIGRPLANARAYVLDRHGRPQPVGVPGELHLGGAAVARGYCGRPELDAAAFVPDPFHGGRMYRTGDLCRWLPSGDLEFLGRLDHQVKIRGFRIELGEIEAAINRHPAVAEGLVLAREDGRGEKQLVAWVAGARHRSAPSAAELRAHLRRDLPEVMIPSAFVILDRLPLTPHGKVDLQALPPPRFEAPATAHVPPRTESERALAAIWRDVLGLETVGLEGHFFELGGHSLLATQVISRVRDRLGVEVPLRAIFEEPTLAGLAGVVDGLRN